MKTFRMFLESGQIYQNFIKAVQKSQDAIPIFADWLIDQGFEKEASFLKNSITEEIIQIKRYVYRWDNDKEYSHDPGKYLYNEITGNYTFEETIELLQSRHWHLSCRDVKNCWLSTETEELYHPQKKEQIHLFFLNVPTIIKEILIRVGVPYAFK